jgi:hypothetical protein
VTACGRMGVREGLRVGQRIGLMGPIGLIRGSIRAQSWNQGARLSENRKADERSYKSYRSHRSYPSFRPTCPYVSRAPPYPTARPLPKQRGLRLGDNALVGQKVVGDDVMDLFDFIEQTIGESHEFVGLEHPAGALFRFKEE